MIHSQQWQQRIPEHEEKLFFLHSARVTDELLETVSPA